MRNEIYGMKVSAEATYTFAETSGAQINSCVLAVKGVNQTEGEAAHRRTSNSTGPADLHAVAPSQRY